MKRLMIACLALAATSALAKPKPTKVEPVLPPPPAEAFEDSDVRMGEEIAKVCVNNPTNGETYDGRDNVYVVEAKDASHAFLRFAGGCEFNALMFAQTIAPSTTDGCLAKGDALIVSDAFGGTKRCEISKINAWHAEKQNLPDEPSY